MSKDQVKPFQNRLYLLYHELRPTRANTPYLVEPAVFQKHVDLFDQLRTDENPGPWPD